MSRSGFLALAFAAMLGFFLGRWTMKPEPVQTFAMPEERLKSGALLIARTPKPAPKESIPELPKGSDLEDVVTVTFKPQSLEPVTLNLARINTPEGPRMVADAQGAIVTGGMDYPKPSAATMPRQWAIGPAAGYEGGKLKPGIAAAYSWKNVTCGGVATSSSVYSFVIIRF